MSNPKGITAAKKGRPAPPDKSLTPAARTLWKIKNSKPGMTWAKVDEIVSEGRTPHYGEGYLYAVAYLQKSPSLDLRYSLGVSRPDIRNNAVRPRMSLVEAEHVYELCKDNVNTEEFAERLKLLIDKKAHLRLL